jgi:hypothetical protein
MAAIGYYLCGCRSLASPSWKLVFSYNMQSFCEFRFFAYRLSLVEFSYAAQNLRFPCFSHEFRVQTDTSNLRCPCFSHVFSRIFAVTDRAAGQIAMIFLW